jgi:hypothetical protein
MGKTGTGHGATFTLHPQHSPYSSGKTQSLRNKIATFVHYPTETISEAFERFNEYTQAVPHHKFLKEDLMQKFYQGLTMASRTIIDASAGGSMLTVNSCIKVLMDLQVDKSPVVVKGPFFPRVVNPRYRIRGTMCNARIQSSKAR